MRSWKETRRLERERVEEATEEINNKGRWTLR